MIINNHFKKTYKLEVAIDLDSCHWDPEWAIEDLECGGQLSELSWKIREDLEDEVMKARKEID